MRLPAIGGLPRLALQPHRAALIVVIVAGAIGTIFQVLGPKILGLATTKYEEVVGKGA